MFLHLSLFQLRISIHALREEGDSQVCHFGSTIFPFLSTPSARRATGVAGNAASAWIFLSTPSARRATSRATEPGYHGSISIHALREEGDSRL